MINFVYSTFFPLFFSFPFFSFLLGVFILASAFWLHVSIMKLIKLRFILSYNSIFFLGVLFLFSECFGCRSLAVKKKNLLKIRLILFILMLFFLFFFFFLSEGFILVRTFLAAGLQLYRKWKLKFILSCF